MFGESGRIWKNLEESGRIWKNLEESGKLMGMIGKNDGEN